jgi:glycosyltransferase involved in cell wall biosynthesis
LENKGKIKLMIAVPSLECGGLERNIAWLANHIDTNKFELVILVVNNANPFFEIKNKDIQVVNLKAAGAKKAMPLIIRMANEFRPDVLMSAANHLNLLCAMNKHKFPKAMKLIARESSIVSLNVKNGKLPLLYNFLLKRFYKKLDLIICQSAYMKTDLHENYHVPSDKLQVINNPVNIPERLVSPQKNTAPVFLSVGRLRPEKSVHKILYAVSKLSFGFKLYIVGNGPEEKRLKHLAKQLGIEEKIKWMGDQVHPFDIPELVDLFLISSDYEGFPNAVLEACSLGIPVVGYDAPGGLREIICEGENGFLIKPADRNAFAEVITKALQYPFDREKIKEDIVNRFSAPAIIKKWESVFENSIKVS